METRCSQCGAAMTCQPEGGCWCAELPRMPMPSDAKGCLCPDCLRAKIKVQPNSDKGLEPWLQSVPGAKELFDWFGYWPSFHDAEVLSIELNRTGASKVRAHTWEMTDRVDPKGFYVCVKHCIVNFLVHELRGVELWHFNNQNALSDLEFYQENDEFVLHFAPGHGLEGSMRAKRVEIEFAPGIPEDSKYEDLDT